MEIRTFLKTIMNPPILNHSLRKVFATARKVLGTAKKVLGTG